MHIYMYVFMYSYIYVYTYVYIYVCICIHTYIYFQSVRLVDSNTQGSFADISIGYIGLFCRYIHRIHRSLLPTHPQDT